MRYSNIADLNDTDLRAIDASSLAEVEADVYWCLTKLLDGIQDHYTPSQPGIQRMIFNLRELVHRIDGWYSVSTTVDTRYRFTW
jgi:hypothetical protein